MTLALPASEPWEVPATAVRRCAGAHGRERIALRMSARRPGAAAPARTPSERAVRSLADLCTRAYEIAVQDPGAPVPEVLEGALRQPGSRTRRARPTRARSWRRSPAWEDDYSPDQPR